MDKFSSVKQPISEDLKEFQRLYSEALVTDNVLLNQVLSHVSRGSGKMMRPVLLLLCARMFGTPNVRSYKSAVSLELLHNSSLIHDDVVDESELRRGNASVNSAFNNKIAVLSGDYLLATCLKYISMTDLQSVELVSQLGQMLSKGELLQLYNTTCKDFSEAAYYAVIRQKTAALFATCAQLGALSVDATPDQVENCRQLGEIIGLIFQIRDDIFDYYKKDVGKPTGNDMREGKITLPAIYVINYEQDPSVYNLALKIRSLQASEEEIEQFIEYIKQKGGIEYAWKSMKKLHDKALSFIPSNAPADIHQSLVDYLDFVSDRDV